MKKSLKQILIESLKNRNGYLSTWEVEAICKQSNAKVSAGERRMREVCEVDRLNENGIEPIYKNPLTKDVVTGYRIKQKQPTLLWKT